MVRYQYPETYTSKSSPVCLIDTAGIWESKEFLDQLAVEKTMSALEDADVCFLVDDNDPAVLLKSNLLGQIKKGFVLIKSKCDLSGSLLKNGENIFSISTKSLSPIPILAFFT